MRGLALGLAVVCVVASNAFADLEYDANYKQGIACSWAGQYYYYEGNLISAKADAEAAKAQAETERTAARTRMEQSTNPTYTTAEIDAAIALGNISMTAGDNFAASGFSAYTNAAQTAGLADSYYEDGDDSLNAQEWQIAIDCYDDAISTYGSACIDANSAKTHYNNAKSNYDGAYSYFGNL